MLRSLRLLISRIPGTGNVSRRQKSTSSVSRQRDRENIQDVGVVGIDPKKLMTTLRGRFEAEFQVHVSVSHLCERLRSANTGGLQMMHNTYRIQASEDLSAVRPSYNPCSKTSVLNPPGRLISRAADQVELYPCAPRSRDRRGPVGSVG